MDDGTRLRVVAGGGEGVPVAGDGPSAIGEGGGYLRGLEGIRLRGYRPRVVCGTCGDERWVGAAEGSGMVRCPDCGVEERLERLARMCASAGIPSRYRPRRDVGATGGGWKSAGLEAYGDEYAEAYRSEAAYERAVSWTKAWVDGREPDGWLYVLGKGRSATALACAVANDLLDAGVLVPEGASLGDGQSQELAGGVLYEGAVDLLDDLRTSYGEQTKPLEARERAERPRLLILDGLAGSPEEKALTRFRALLEHRDGEMLPTIVVSRHAPGDLVVGFGDEVSDLLGDACEVLDLTGAGDVR